MAPVETIVSGMAGRYALALFELAKDNRAVDAVASDLDRFSAMIDGSPDLQLLIRSPAFSAEDQTRALGEVLKSAEIGGIAANFLKLVASKRRLFAVRGMIADFAKLNDADKHVRRATVTVAEALSDDRLGALKDALRGATGESVEVKVSVDPAILGGLTVQMGSRMIDGSLRTKLNALRTRMKEVG